MPLSVADRLDIQELIARYNHTIDSGDAAAWASNFTADGTLDFGGRTYTGVEALRAFATDFAEKLPGSRHWTANLVAEGDHDEATARCYLQVFRAGGGEPAALLTTARVEDRLRRVAGEWRFVSRTVVRD